MKFKLPFSTSPKAGIGNGRTAASGRRGPAYADRRGSRWQGRRHPPSPRLAGQRNRVAATRRLARGGRPVPQRDLRLRSVRAADPHVVSSRTRVPGSGAKSQSYYRGFPGPDSMLTAETNQLTAVLGPFPGQVGADPAATAQDDIYETRRSRTPVPEWVSEACGTHLAKIYDQEVFRDPDSCPDELLEWWKDVDGCGTDIDDYMRETIAPLLLTLGTLDVLCDYPAAPPGVEIVTHEDELRFGLDQIVASYILPENVVWWSHDHAGRYVEVLVREYVDPADRLDHDKDGNAIDPNAKNDKADKWRQSYVRWRLWRADKWILYNFDGSEILDQAEHKFGRVPIIRLTAIKKHRSKMVGKSVYQAVAGLQRAYYNLDSELILSDTLQATPLLCIPEDFLKGDITLSIGAQFALPMKKNQETGGYTAPVYIAPQSNPADSLRKDKEDLRAAADRAACLSKPAGAETPGTVGQSGLSKQMDMHTGHKMLTSIAKILAKAETFVAELALVVKYERDLTPEETQSIKIGYPSKFDIQGPAAMLLEISQLQLIANAVGNLPMVEQALLSAAVRQMLLGLDDSEYEAMDDEIEFLVQSKSRLKEKMRELPSAVISTKSKQAGPGGQAEDDPSGVSGGTSLGNTVSTLGAS